MFASIGSACWCPSVQLMVYLKGREWKQDRRRVVDMNGEKVRFYWYRFVSVPSLATMRCVMRRHDIHFMALINAMQ